MIVKTLFHLALATFFWAGPSAAQSQYPSVSHQKLNAGLYKADCNPRTMLSRSTAVQKHQGLYAFPLRLCLDETISDKIVFWTKRKGGSVQLAIATQKGRGIKIIGSKYDANSGARILKLAPKVKGKVRECTLIRPKGGLAPYGEVYCQ